MLKPKVIIVIFFAFAAVGLGSLAWLGGDRPPAAQPRDVSPLAELLQVYKHKSISDLFGAMDIRETGSNQDARDFELESLGGKTVGLAELKGRVVLVNFWATW